ncbi:hypothetical protein Tco_1205590 [Tanacetum coccineum]
MIDIIDTTCDDHFPKVFTIQKSIHLLCGSPAPSSDLIIASLTPFEDIDLLLEETNAFFALDSIPHYIDDGVYDSKEDILFLENLLKGDLLEAEKVSETPMDSLDSILDTFDSAFTNPLFELDSEYSLNYDNSIFDIQNKDSDESETETIMNEVQFNDSQCIAQIPPPFKDLSINVPMHDIILSRFRHGMVDSSCLSFYPGLLFLEGFSKSHSLDLFELGDENVMFDPRTITINGRIKHYHGRDIPTLQGFQDRDPTQDHFRL